MPLRGMQRKSTHPATVSDMAAQRRGQLGTQLVGRGLRLGARVGTRTGSRHVPLLSGAVHYWRIDRAHWRAALESVHTMGFPMVETYVPWSVHEMRSGEFDFGQHNPQHDVGAFVDLAHELGLRVFIRPGPHINAELTYFGIPERVILDEACQARSAQGGPVMLAFPPVMFPVPSYASTAFFAEVARWYDAVGQVLGPRAAPSGPIALVQVDNEAAFYFRNGLYDQDYHPDAIALWHAMLKHECASLDEVGERHDARYSQWADVRPPTRFSGERERRRGELVRQLDWARFQEELVAGSLARMAARLGAAGFEGLPTVHNLPLGEATVPMSIPKLESSAVQVAGLDYYHSRQAQDIVQRRTMWLAGSSKLPYAPELGAGVPPWFTPLQNEDSLCTALVALAYGLRGFNLYMAVDRDRWVGAPIDPTGVLRIEAAVWKHLITALRALSFQELERRAHVGLLVPREYLRLARATQLGGPLSAATLEAIVGSPVVACRNDTLGFEHCIQIDAWESLVAVSAALDRAQVPHVWIDSATPLSQWAHLPAVYAPSFEFAAADRIKQLVEYASQGGRVWYGPQMPSLDETMRRHLFEVPRNSVCMPACHAQDADHLVRTLVHETGFEPTFSVSPSCMRSTVHGTAESRSPAGRASDEPRVLFVMDRRALCDVEPLVQDATVHLPEPYAAVDVLSGETFVGERELQIPMRPSTCRMLELRRLGHSQAQGKRRARSA
jgi:beta-galactosidase